MLKNFLSLRTTKIDLNPEKNVVSHVKIFSDLNRLQRKQTFLPGHDISLADVPFLLSGVVLNAC